MPEDQKSLEFDRINKLKHDKILKKISNNDLNFDGTKLFRLIFVKEKFKNIKMSFLNAEIKDHVEFYECNLLGSVIFDGAKIGGHAWFKESELWDVSFVGTNVDNAIIFQGSIIYGNVNLNGRSGSIIKKVWFWNSESDCNIFINNNNIKEKIQFDNGSFGGNIEIIKSHIGGDLNFNNIITKKEVNLNESHISGNIQLKMEHEAISLKSTKFISSPTQEKACRYSKTFWEGLGDRERSDYYFYREMDAKRKQKSYFFRFLEWYLIQIPFGYGVYPLRVVISWISIILIFTVIYSTQNGVNGNLGFFSYLYTSVVTAITPGFGNYHPEGFYQLVASFEAIIGTFMWVTLIATFTRKYMR